MEISVPIDVSGALPIEVSGEKLAQLNKRLFPDNAIHSSMLMDGSPQRHLQLIKSDNNSVSTLDDQAISGSRQAFVNTPNSSRSRPGIEEEINSERENSKDGNESGAKRPRENEKENINDGRPPVKSPTFRVVEDQSGTVFIIYCHSLHICQLAIILYILQRVAHEVLQARKEL